MRARKPLEMRAIDTTGADIVLDMRLDTVSVLACNAADGVVIEAKSACNSRPNGTPLCVRFALTYAQLLQLETQVRAM